MLNLDRGRINQKRRTRAALVTAAVGLIRQGNTPSVAEAADAAQVAKSTAYSYFPTQEALLAQATVDLAAEEWTGRFGTSPASGPDDAPAERVDAVIRRMHALLIANEAAFRTMLRVSLDPRLGEADGIPRRPGRRIMVLEEALADTREQLREDRFNRLLAALSLCTGIEASVVLRDIWSLQPDEAEAVVRWAARALVRASLEEASSSTTLSEGGLDDAESSLPASRASHPV